tara:strand:- start:3228 stop:3554 length:327 start_codon:yes stop_codon:yes gene_type:complete
MKDKKYNKLCNNFNNKVGNTIERFLNKFKMKDVPEISRDVIGAVFLNLLIEHYKHHYSLTPKAINTFSNHIKDCLLEMIEKDDDDNLPIPSNKINGEYEVLEDLGAEA